ncbi:MAG TPA: hypothetical protein VHB02_04930 [Acidimicrobiales bacterium]|nr:hypothetical protein [Acidimicrobiales bacterium]
MGTDLTRWLEDQEGEGRQQERYAAPPVLSRLGALDRQKAGRHVIKMRNLERMTQEAVATEASQAIQALARQERQVREAESAKLHLERQHRLSQALAAGDPELLAEFGVIDTEFFQHLRLDLRRQGA